MRILVAEDEPAVRRLLSQTLVKLGHEVVTVETGRAALEAFEREYFPALISDWLMPEINGLELCRRIRAQKRAKYTYVILLTALGGKGRFLEGMNAGADDFITKPFDPEELQARLRVAERILGLQTEVHQLQSLLPICSYARRSGTSATSGRRSRSTSPSGPIQPSVTACVGSATSSTPGPNWSA